MALAKAADEPLNSQELSTPAPPVASKIAA